MFNLPGQDSEVIRITDPQNDRYASSRLINWWDQARMAAAHIMVVGAGAIGNEVLKNLALLGVGHVYIIDFDAIEISNLTRTVLYRETDIGRSKAEVAAERVHALNPNVTALALNKDVVRDVGLGLFRRMDIVLGCLDNREARWAVNRACWRMGKPWVDGSLDTLNGTVKVFIPPHGGCYECNLTEIDRQVMMFRYSCPQLRPEDLERGRVPTTITSASITAGMQVQEALKLLHGLPVLPGSTLWYDGQEGGLLRSQIKRQPNCLAHEVYTPIVELDVTAHELTLSGLLHAVQKHLGTNAQVNLDRLLVTSLVCQECKETEATLRAYERITPVDLTCPKCGGSRFPELTRTLSSDIRHLNLPLSVIGIPPLHILEARNGARKAYFELTKDASALLIK